MIHTVPATKRRLPVIVGYADSRGQWYQDGSRHVEVQEADEPIEDKQVAVSYTHLDVYKRQGQGSGIDPYIAP